MRLLVERKGACVVQKSCRCTRCALLCVIAVAGLVGAVPTRRAATSEVRQLVVLDACCTALLPDDARPSRNSRQREEREDTRGFEKARPRRRTIKARRNAAQDILSPVVVCSTEDTLLAQGLRSLVSSTKRCEQRSYCVPERGDFVVLRPDCFWLCSEIGGHTTKPFSLERGEGDIPEISRLTEPDNGDSDWLMSDVPWRQLEHKAWSDGLAQNYDQIATVGASAGGDDLWGRNQVGMICRLHRHSAAKQPQQHTSSSSSMTFVTDFSARPSSVALA